MKIPKCTDIMMCVHKLGLCSNNIIMKKIIYLFVITLFTSSTFIACKKDKDTDPSGGNNNTTACNGKNLCMKLDGTQISQDAREYIGQYF